MKIGLVIPSKPGRELFVLQSLAMIQRQTLQPDLINLVDEQTDLKTDITYRYRVGIEQLKEAGCDLIIFWENDDYYANNYIKTMVKEWRKNKKPLLFGIGQTIYYHVKKKKYTILEHNNRASAMSTMIHKDLFIDFPEDTEKFFDIHLWRNGLGKTFTPTKPINIGIKHGIGYSGGKGHSDKFKYDNEDLDMKWLKQKTNKETFAFYKSLSKI